MDVIEIRDELESLGPTEFLERYGRYFLVLTDPDSLDDFASFVNTATRQAHEIGSANLDRVDIRPLVPRRRGADRVTIGREDADVELTHRKISKLHARFMLHGGLLSLVDAGSKNGTWVNGKLLSPEHPVPIDVGDTISFGAITATVWGLDDLKAAAR